MINFPLGADSIYPLYDLVDKLYDDQTIGDALQTLHKLSVEAGKMYWELIGPLPKDRPHE